ncbi:MAG: ATP-binding protein [Sporomusaceae bacterium]|jgi:hypothetical protein|nr:ATP-binding protein [Sporomusaceae bacterium]
MAQEKGGRADKFGNRYEYRWVAKQLVRLSIEEILGLIHEPVGEIEAGVDIQIYNRDGSIELHQCKVGNGHKNEWTISDLNSRKVFVHAKKHLDSSQNFHYKFISPSNCNEMTTLIQRANNSQDPVNFYEIQIKPNNGRNHPEIQKKFLSFLKYMELPSDETASNFTDSINKSINYLSRMEFIMIPDTDYERQEIIRLLSVIFAEDSRRVYELLLNYTIENDRLGKNITVAEINDYLATNNIYKSDLSNHNQIWDRINTLNQEFESVFTPDFGRIPRQETEDIYSLILDNKAILVHGKAGTGKSGCLRELIGKLKENQIPYLALSLDKRPPENSARKYGEILDLPASPILCLSQLASSGRSVLILDQLDAIRWTSKHSTNALNICKELINQMERINNANPKSRISIIFVCRTIDVETDNGIKSLFLNDKHELQRYWEKISIGNLNEETVKSIVGKFYHSFTPKFKELLQNINNLCIWSKLTDERKKIQYASTFHLIRGYWEQFKEKYETLYFSNNDVSVFKKTLIDNMTANSRTYIPKFMLEECSSKVKNIAVSEGIIIENDSRISFVHQSFYDVFIVEAMFRKIRNGNSIGSLLGLPHEQTPQLRYQFQMLLQFLGETDQSLLVQSSKELFQNSNIRYYMKYVFWEVIGQLTKIEQPLIDFVLDYMKSPDWFQPIVNTVIDGHPHYVDIFLKNGLIFSWLNSEKIDTALRILQSVNTVMGDQIVDLVRPFAFQNKDMDVKLYSVLCWNIEDDSDKMFDFRIQLIEQNPGLMRDYFNFKAIANRNLNWAMQLLEIIIKSKANAIEENIGHYICSDFNIFKHLAQKVPEYVWDIFMPIINTQTSNIVIFWSAELRFWSSSGIQPTVGKSIVEMTIAAGKNLAMEQPKKFEMYFSLYSTSQSLIINEILLYTLIDLPENYADNILNWLISDSFSHMFDETGKYEKKLDAAKKLIEKYSKFCSDETFTSLEVAITNYHDKNEFEIAKYRFNHNQMVRKGNSSKGNFESYEAYWGKVQAYLLPALDINRISVKTKQLICVLKRRFTNYSLGGNKLVIRSGWVSASIPQNISENFSDKQWLRTIKNQKINNRDFRERSSHEQFARLYEKAGEANPERFVGLANKFPHDVNRHYIQAVWSIAAKMTGSNDKITDWKPASFDSVKRSVELLFEHPEKDELQMCMSFCRLVHSRANEDWPAHMINHIIFLALSYKESERVRVSGNTNDLYTEALNCVRGSAAIALSSLLWETDKRYVDFKLIISILVQDKNPAIRLAIMEAVIATSKIDKEQSKNWFFELVDSDERIARHNRSIEMFFKFWAKYKDECNTAIQKLFYSTDEKSSEKGAFIVVCLYIFYDEDTSILKEMIFSGFLSTAQIKGCYRAAIDYMGEIRFHDKAKSVIEQLIKYSEEAHDYLDNIFYSSKFILPQDIELIKKIINLNPSKSFMNFQYYLEHNKDVSVLDFKDVILDLCKTINNLKSEDYYYFSNHLPALVILLYEQALDIKDDKLCNECLDVWDSFYKSNMGNARKLTQQIMDY